MKTLTVRFKVNGQEFNGELPTDMTLLHCLRELLGAVEVKNGCEKGDCGSCTVLLDGLPVNSCLVLAVQAHGREITTVKAMGSAEGLHPLQKNFIDHGAIQCGFCTPGMLLSAKSLLDKHPNPSREEVKEQLSGNLCRCTGYTQIVDAVLACASESSEA
jgi:carbon-monoxide dehydrogenase small subunit